MAAIKCRSIERSCGVFELRLAVSTQTSEAWFAPDESNDTVALEWQSGIARPWRRLAFYGATVNETEQRTDKSLDYASRPKISGAVWLSA
jgi:hypothetical protein